MKMDLKYINKIEYLLIGLLFIINQIKPNIWWLVFSLILLVNKDFFFYKKYTTINILLTCGVIFIPELFKLVYLISIFCIFLGLNIYNKKNRIIMLFPFLLISPPFSYLQNEFTNKDLSYDKYGYVINNKNKEQNKTERARLINTMENKDIRYTTILIPTNKEEIIEDIIYKKYTFFKDYAYKELLKSPKKCELLFAGAMNGWKDFELLFLKDNSCREKVKNGEKIQNPEALFSKG